jgi:hypothetical protein
MAAMTTRRAARAAGLALALAAALLLAAASATPTTRFVNPLFATRGGAGFGGWGNPQRAPSAKAPFPLLRLSPVTTRLDPVVGEIWSKLNRHGGYFGSDNAIRFFAHTGTEGAGEADGGNFGVAVLRGDASAVAARLARAIPRPLGIADVTTDLSPFAAL